MIQWCVSNKKGSTIIFVAVKAAMRPLKVPSGCWEWVNSFDQRFFGTHPINQLLFQKKGKGATSNNCIDANSELR